MNRVTTNTVTFLRPFALPDIDGMQAPGGYTVETEEELLPTLTFEAWHRVSTMIHLPKRAGGSQDDRWVSVDPEMLEAALAADSV